MPTGGTELCIQDRGTQMSWLICQNFVSLTKTQFYDPLKTPLFTPYLLLTRFSQKIRIKLKPLHTKEKLLTKQLIVINRLREKTQNVWHYGFC